jgi:hypothetical protein
MVLVSSAAVVLVAAAVLVATRSTEVDLESEQPLAEAEREDEAPIPDSGAERHPDLDPTGEPADPEEVGRAGRAPFPEGVEVGPDRTPMSAIPFGRILLVYDAGGVVVDVDGTILGHYPAPIPTFVHDPDGATVPAVAVPDGCQLDAILGHGQQRVFCHDDVGPTVEVITADHERRPLAAFPPPPENLGPDAFVPGHFTAAHPNPAAGRGGPMLLQMSAECEIRVAMMVDDATWSSESPDGGTVRLLDGTGYWDGGWLAGESIALGWSADGDEAYVWRFASVCSDDLAAPGVYAYRLDGSGRLLFPTDDEVRQVAVITDHTADATTDRAG